MSGAIDPQALMAKFGIKTQAEVKDNTYARVLLLAPPKAGKTTVIAGTAPGPVLMLACDGSEGATKGARTVYKDSSDFIQLNVPVKGTRLGWKKAVEAAKEMSKAGLIKSVAVDTLNILQSNLLDDITLKLDNYDIWNAVYKELVTDGLKVLIELPVHVFVTCHLTPAATGEVGVMPAIAGKAKNEISGLLDDIVLLTVGLEGQQPKREFVLGPQKEWPHNGRNVKRSCVIPASIPALLKELGIDP